MVDELTAFLAANGHVASSVDLARLDLSTGQVKQLIRTGRLHRYRRSAFVDRAVWDDAAPWERHVLRARAVAGVLCGDSSPYLLSHHSALAVHGLAMHGVDDRVHLVRTDGARGRSDATIHVHPPVRPGCAATATDPPTVTVALACMQVAATFGIVPGLVSADAALRQEATTASHLEEAARQVGPGRGRSRVRTVLEHADGLSGSAGESRCRWTMHTMGLPAPLLQAVIRDEHGGLVAVADFLFREQWTVVEFDGALKYGDHAALVAEKHREDRLRELGYEVVRVTWADLSHPGRIATRIRAAFGRAAVRHSPGA